MILYVEETLDSTIWDTNSPRLSEYTSSKTIWRKATEADLINLNIT